MTVRRAPRGFTLIELLITLAVIGIITTFGTPTLLSALRASTLRAGAEELVSAFNRGRQLAVSENRAVCVTHAARVIQYRPGTCADAIARETQLTSNMTVSSAANVSFTYLGAATPAVTYTVTHPQDGRTLSVVVSPSGRVSIAP